MSKETHGIQDTILSNTKHDMLELIAIVLEKMFKLVLFLIFDKDLSIPEVDRFSMLTGRSNLLHSCFVIKLLWDPLSRTLRKCEFPSLYEIVTNGVESSIQ